MKIALLMVGRLDTFENMYPTLNKYVLEPLSKELNIAKKKFKIFGTQKNIFLESIMKG